MYNNTKLKVLKEIYLHPGIHKRAISRNIGLSMPSVENAMKTLMPFLKIKTSGNQLHYSLNYSQHSLTPYLCAIEQYRLSLLPKKAQLVIEDYLAALPDKPLIAAIFGSYARGDYRKNSDLDLFLVYQSLDKPDMIESIAEQVSLTSGIRLNPVYLDYRTFRKSFANLTKGFFKELRQDRLVIAGLEWWRMLEVEIA